MTMGSFWSYVIPIAGTLAVGYHVFGWGEKLPDLPSLPSSLEGVIPQSQGGDRPLQDVPFAPPDPEGTLAGGLPGEASPVTDQDCQDYLDEVAGGSEYGSYSPYSRWQSPVRIAIYGTPTDSNWQELNSVIQELSQLTGLDIAIAQQGEYSNIALHFIPEAEFSQVVPQYIPLNLGFFWVDREGSTLTNAIVLISTTGVTPEEQNHLLREELTQSLGFPNDSERYEDSIFYAKWTTTSQYSGLDRCVIRLLYQP